MRAEEYERVHLVCSACGADLTNGSHYCGNCGAELTNVPPQSPGSTKYATAVLLEGAAPAVPSEPTTNVLIVQPSSPPARTNWMWAPLLGLAVLGLLGTGLLAALTAHRRGENAVVVARHTQQRPTAVKGVSETVVPEPAGNSQPPVVITTPAPTSQPPIIIQTPSAQPSQPPVVITPPTPAPAPAPAADAGRGATTPNGLTNLGMPGFNNPLVLPPARPAAPAIEVISVRAAPSETSGANWTYGYSVKLRNNTTSRLRTDVHITFHDVAGYVVEDDVLTGLLLEPNSEAVYDGTDLISAGIGPSVRTIRAELR